MSLKIHVYTIAKNEEQFCERWVKSASGADGLHVLDTGSADNTVPLLKTLGANVSTMAFDSWKTIEEYEAIVSRGGNPWRFEIARNSNLDMLPPDADVCLQVDMDEVLVDDWRDIVSRHWSKGTTRMDYFYAWTMDGNTPKHQFRYNKCHSRNGYRWIKPVHEVLWPIDGFRERVSYCNDLLVKHFPANKDRSSYLHLLRLSCHETPLDATNSFNLAREYSFYSMWTDVLAEVRRYLLLPTATWPLERATACILASKACGGLNDKTGQEKWLLRAVSEESGQREGWCELADYYRVCGQNVGGYFAAKKALAVTTNPRTHYNTVEAWREMPHDIAAVCGFYAGFRRESLDHSWMAIKENPFDDRLIKNYEQTHAAVKPKVVADGPAVVDVVILAWSKDAEHYNMAVRCIDNLRLSSSGISLNIVVVETNSSLKSESFVTLPAFGERVEVLYPDEPFGYNKYLQIAHRHLEKSPAKFFMILNNDVVAFSHDFMVRMIIHMNSFSSVSPLGLRETKWGRIDESRNIHPGYDLNVINGWCILFDKAILNSIPFNDVFPSEIEFHRQDEFYADMLRLHGIRHALVCDAQALHLQAQSGGLLDDDTKKRFTIGQEAPYIRLLAEATSKISSGMRPLVYDCFTFWRELEILEMRLETLCDVVDKFVIVEATKTHSGKSKPLFFDENKDRFSKFKDKIIHVVVRDMPVSDDRWALENHQRNSITRGLTGARSNDIIMISDVDEIPRPESLKTCGVDCSLSLNMYNYFYNLRNTVDDWAGTVVLRNSDLAQKTPQFYRDARYSMRRIKNAGWHFSWIGDIHSAREKLESFAHAEFDNQETKDKLEARLSARVDFAGRHWNVFSPENISVPEFPKFMIDHKMSFILPVLASHE